MKDDMERDITCDNFQNLECYEEQCPYRNVPEQCPYMKWVKMWRDSQRQMQPFGNLPGGPGPVIIGGANQGGPGPVISGGSFGPGGPGPVIPGGPFGPFGPESPEGSPQGNQPPKTPPPNFTPRPNEAMSINMKAIDSGAIQPCRYRFSYIWLRNGTSFWAYIVFVGRKSIAGWRYRGRNWTYFGVELRDVRSFACY